MSDDHHICTRCDVGFDCPENRNQRGAGVDPICDDCWDDLDREEGEGRYAPDADPDGEATPRRTG